MGNSQADMAAGPPGDPPIVVHNFAEADSLLSTALIHIMWNVDSHIQALENSNRLPGPEKALLVEQAESIRHKLEDLEIQIDYTHTPD